MACQEKQWAVAVSYAGFDPQIDSSLAAIAAQHGGTPKTLAAYASYGLGFEFHERSDAESAREAMLAFRPGKIVATELQPSN